MEGERYYASVGFFLVAFLNQTKDIKNKRNKGIYKKESNVATEGHYSRQKVI